ncbi:MAG: hypothetical protein J6K21_05655 [Bacilli bacterium]|nr:hypothetical protein [Bacilli bacterium]
MARIISIEPLEPPTELKIMTSNPTTKRRYAVDSDVVSSLEKFNESEVKKGVISSEDIKEIKPEFDGELPVYEEKPTLKSIFRKLGKLNGKLSKDNNFKNLIVKPKELQEALNNLNLEKQASEMEELLKNTNQIIEEKNNIINELQQEIDYLKRENMALDTVNQALISGDESKEKVR